MRRGLIYNLLSNIVFFLSGYILHFFLGHTMPAASYGIVGTIITVLDFEYMFLSNGARQSLAKEISMHRYDVVDVIAKTVGFQLIVIAFFFAVNFFGAPVFGMVLNDASLDAYFRLAAFLIPANGMFVILLGINDGLRHFGISAILGTIYPIAKLAAIPLIIFVFDDDPVTGVEVGFLSALLFSIIVGCVLLIPYRNKLDSRGHGKISFRNVAAHTLSFSFFFIVVSLVLSIDTLVVKSVVHPAPMAGYYTGAVNFGKLSYYLMSAFVTVILPVIANMVGAGRHGEAAERTKEIVLTALVLILPAAVIISASSGTLLGVFYGADFSIAASALSFLALSSFCMGMTVMFNMVLNAYNIRRFSDALSVGALIIVIPIFTVAARVWGITGIAAASAACTFALMVISGVKLARVVTNVLTAKACETIVAACLLWALSRVIFSRLPISNIFQLGGIYTLMYVAYVLVLIFLKVVPVPKLSRKDRQQ